MPAPETVTERASKVVFDDEPVVLPAAKPSIVCTDWLVVALRTKALCPAAVVESPTLMIPAPERVSEAFVADDVAAVVLPNANMLSVAAPGAGPEITQAPAPAAVVEKPTLIAPAPDIETLDSVCV